MRPAAVFVAAAVACVLAGPAEAAERHETASLACGVSTFRAETAVDPLLDPDVMWRGQTLRVQRDGDAPPRVIHPTPRAEAPGRHGGLPAVVISWACLNGADRHYVLVSYDCAGEGRGGVCQGEKEWFRLLDEDGRRLDDGYAPQDRRYEALYARLGLVEAMRAGIRMTGVGGP